MAIRKTSDLRPDKKNINRGTERGRDLIEHSIRRVGFGRSLVADKHGNVIVGNQTLNELVDLGMENVVVVKTKGDKVIVHQREDLDLTKGGRARELAVLDNRSQELSYNADPSMLVDLQNQGFDMKSLGFMEVEVQKALAQAQKEMEKDAKPEKQVLLDQAVQLRPEREYIVVMCDNEAQFDKLSAAIGLTQVRRGGYAKGHSYDAVGRERVVPAAKLLKKLKG
jgi:hypothetical protein